MHVVLPWAWPSHGSYLSQGLPAVAWVLHESSYPLLVLELRPWSHLPLLFITVMRYWGLSRSRPLHGLSFPWVSGGGTVDALTLATPTPGDASSSRRLTQATPTPSDASPWRRLQRSTRWLSSLGPPWGVLTYVDFDFDFDFGQHLGTGRYTSPPSLELTLVSAKRLRPRPIVHMAFLLTWHSFDQLTWSSLSV